MNGGIDKVPGGGGKLAGASDKLEKELAGASAELGKELPERSTLFNIARGMLMEGKLTKLNTALG